MSGREERVPGREPLVVAASTLGYEVSETPEGLSLAVPGLHGYSLAVGTAGPVDSVEVRPGRWMQIGTWVFVVLAGIGIAAGQGEILGAALPLSLLGAATTGTGLAVARARAEAARVTLLDRVHQASGQTLRG